VNKLVLRTAVWNIAEIKNTKDNQIQFRVTGITDYDKFRKQLDRKETQIIKVQTGKTVTAIYENYTNVIYPLGINEIEDGSLEVIVTLQKEDEILSRLAAVEDALKRIILKDLGAM
jgi:hypothetical protein